MILKVKLEIVNRVITREMRTVKSLEWLGYTKGRVYVIRKR